MNGYFHLSYRQLIQLILAGTISLLVIFVVFSYFSKAGPETGYIYADMSPDTVVSGTPCSDIEYQSYVTPDSPAIRDTVSGLNGIHQAYEIACNWLYVPEKILNGVDDKWETPEAFLRLSPLSDTNPVPGQIAGDCEEQANTLVSMMRALGVPAENVRVVLGVVTSGKVNLGHVWVEIYLNGKWLDLDPSQGVKWNALTETADTRNCLSFDYYTTHPYPVTHVTAYYNDTYYTSVDSFGNNIPANWKTGAQ